MGHFSTSQHGQTGHRLPHAHGEVQAAQSSKSGGSADQNSSIEKRPARNPEFGFRKLIWVALAAEAREKQISLRLASQLQLKRLASQIAVWLGTEYGFVFLSQFSSRATGDETPGLAHRRQTFSHRAPLSNTISLSSQLPRLVSNSRSFCLSNS